ncbi:MAG: 2-amino-4-hydroxy-6-hydroxymethyldihydropteridine diphosphokinase [Steroidobacteraceae bacterium]|jgi:2-amino-4-hydroxy-6-hydroxymethyldihydropteridine diphosphokinase
MQWRPAYVGLGSNLDDPRMQIRRALTALQGLPHTRLQSHSSMYRSRPLGPVAQPDYVNAVAVLLTQLEAPQLFSALRTLERELGRAPAGERWGPRRIDLDLLIYAQLLLEGPELQLPHPGIVARNFVLYPLNEVAPELEVPGRGRVAELAAVVTPEGIWRLQDETMPP